MRSLYRTPRGGGGVHSRGVQAVDGLGETGTTIALPGTPFVPSRFHAHSLPSSVPGRPRPQSGLPCCLHRMHSAYNYDHLLSSRDLALPRARSPYPPVTSKERV